MHKLIHKLRKTQHMGTANSLIEEESENNFSSCLNEISRESLIEIESKKSLEKPPLSLEIKSPWTIIERQSKTLHNTSRHSELRNHSMLQNNPEIIRWINKHSNDTIKQAYSMTKSDILKDEMFQRVFERLDYTSCGRVKIEEFALIFTSFNISISKNEL